MRVQWSEAGVASQEMQRVCVPSFSPGNGQVIEVPCVVQRIGGLYFARIFTQETCRLSLERVKADRMMFFKVAPDLNSYVENWLLAT